MNSPTKSHEEEIQKYLKSQGKIAQLIQLRALSWLNNSEARQAKSDQAERNWFAKQMGEPIDGATDEASDDMATTILGDVTHPTPIVINQPPQPASNPLLPIAVAGLLGLLGAGTGAAATAYLLSQRPTPSPQAFDFETMNLGLGRASDFLKDESAK
jgi:hypothetical protein